MPHYDAIIFDVDGTLSPYSEDGMPAMPSHQVIAAIQEAKKVTYVGIATSRPLSKMRIILNALQLNCLLILHNGAQIIRPNDLKTIWMSPLGLESLQKLYEISVLFSIQTFFSDFENNIPVTSLDELTAGPVADVFFDGVDTQIYDAFNKELLKISDIAVHRLSSKWTDKYELSITHVNATKQNAISEVAKVLQIKTGNIIGVGDGYNDISLLMACGLKVAMGNAVDELKDIADFIAPSVDQDGAKAIIDKFILARL